MIDRPKRGFMQFQDVRSFLGSVLSEDIHAKRVDSFANAALGVMTGASLAVAMIGRSLAQARGLLTKHAVKQVDRLLSNPGIEAWDIFATWVPEMVGSRPDIVVALDWTDYDADGQATLALNLVTRHGRATPLVWLSVFKGGPQRLRRRRPATARRSAAGRYQGDRPGRPRLRRHQAVRLPRQPRLRLRHPAEGQHPGQRGRWDDPAGGRVGRPRRPGAQTARRHGHRGAVPGRGSGVRAHQGHAGALVPGHQQP